MRIRQVGFRSFVAAAAVALAVTPAGAQTTITSVTGAGFMIEGPHAPAFGQTFMTPDTAARFLDQFTVYFGAAGPASFVAWVQLFDPTYGMGVGVPLYEGTIAASGRPQDYTFDIGGIELDPNQLYEFYVMPQNAQGLRLEYVGDTYAGGYAVDGYAGGPANDLVFSATFHGATPEVTPEPVSMVLLTTGLLGLGGLARRKRRARRS